jgi:purine-cytosine permease-like protein
MEITEILGNIIYFLIAFIFVFLIDYFVITKKRTKKTKEHKGTCQENLTTEGMYLISRFNLDDKLINLKQINFHISIINAFIISFVATNISLIKLNLIFQFLIGFVVLFLLIYAIYEIYGRNLKKKWGKK